MSDFISNMTDAEIEKACVDVLKWPCSTGNEVLVGLMIEKLIQWEFRIMWSPSNDKWELVKYGSNSLHDRFFEKSLQRCFLRAAHALGHLIHPQKEELHYYRLKADHAIVLPKHLATNGNLWERVTVTPYEPNSNKFTL